MSKKKVYDISAALEKKFGAPGSEQRDKAIEKAWDEYNAHVLMEARKNAQLSQSELAERIGANKSYISRIERGLTVPTVATFYKIAAAMGLRVELRPC